MTTLRVVIVDDEPPARTRLRQLLAELGGSVVVGEAGDGDEAQSIIETTRPDVVFMDVDMPERSGTAVAAALPEPRPFIVFATAFERYALDAFSVDATDYLLKPITRGRLAATVARLRDRVSRRSDLERELIAASAAQANLLPRALPVIDGYDCAARTIPARGVSGDFYIAQALDGLRFAFALGDVAGKGMSAGLVASSLQARLETTARHGRGTAAEVIRDINTTLCGSADAARFATLVYIELDAARNTIDVVNAGHLPVVLAPPAGRRTLIPSTGPALGLLTTARFESVHMSVVPGATIVTCSDGVTDTLDDEGEEFGEARFAQEIDRGRELSAADLCRRLIELVRDHRGSGAAADDTSVLVLRNTRA